MEKLTKESFDDILALSPMQEGMLFHYLENPGSDLYFEQLSLVIPGKIHIDIFEKAWDCVIKSNEMLRTVFRWENVRHPVQIILKEYRFQPVYYDLSPGPADEALKYLEELKINDRKRPFDLRLVPFRVTLCKMPEDRYVMIFSNHHILFDGWSLGILLAEFFHFYDDVAAGNPFLIPVKTPYKEFIEWLNNRDETAREKFWQNYLAGFDQPVELSVKNSARKKVSQIESYVIKFEPMLRAQAEDFVRQQKITLASLFYSALGILFLRYNNTEEVIFGSVVSGRPAEINGIEDMVGLFINTPPLRIHALSPQTSAGFVKNLDDQLRAREKHEATSLVKIREYAGIPHGTPLFDTIAIIENYPLESRLNRETSRLTAASYSMFEATHYDLAIEIKLWQGIEVKFSYAAAALEPNIIINMAGHFRRIIEAIITNPDKEITGMEFLSPEEKNALLYEFNHTAAAYPGHKCLHRLFMEQASRTPDHVALMQIKSITLTYNELNNQSDRWAALLIEKGIRADDIVALKMERSIDLITAIFGILKSGGAYLPIDPGYPQERIDYMLKDSNAGILIGMEECRKKIIVNNQLSIDNCQLFMNPVQVSSHSNQLAYIIYTSGSTGKPKGVMIEHRGVVNYILWAVERYVKNERVNFPLFTSISFDLTVTSIFAPLVSGNSLVIYPQETAANLVEKIILDNITGVVKLTPTHLQLIRDLKIEKRINALKRLIVGGEKLSVELAADIYNNFLGQVEIYNEYGPTETVVGSMLYRFDPAKDTAGSVPIGVPAANTQVYILDKHLQLLPPGAPGELVIGGDGVARGYLNNPELTAEKFFNFHHSAFDIPRIQHSNLYCTGDLARWLPDGHMEFLGRIDRQVKIRGHRVEPEEIEEQLLKIDGIRETAVVVLENPGGETRLHAFIAAGNEPSTADIKSYLVGRLPAYMVPAHFSRLEKIPLTPGGKVDRKKLISMACEGNVTLTGPVPHAAPGTDLEKIIADAWQEILGTDKMGIHDNFFDIGGNSLSLIRLNSRLKKILKKEIPMVTLFDYPTVASLARYLKGEEAPRPDNENKIAPKGTEVAVIGMAGRFPGAANVHEFWENLQNGLESISFFSKLELKQLGIKAEWVDNPHYVKAKGVLDGIENFDFPFFDYTAREADNMDPQLRVLHECAWTALEDAGYNPGTYDGGIGVYAGSTFNVHWISGLLNKIKSPLELFDLGNRNNNDSFATSLSYKLDLKGPAVVVQTACSTSLAAIHTACKALLNGECDMALAGGVSVTLPGKSGYLYQDGMIFSPDGHCRAFDAEAGGTVPGNGVGMVVLKPLEKALADKDFIYAVVKATAANNDGKRKVGYTAPSVKGQAEVILAAHNAAGVEVESIGCIETHGTATPLGDAVEIEALKQAFNTDKKNVCAVGSVKTNIGHLDAAAGVAGFIKTVLMLTHKTILPSLHFKTANAGLGLENSPFYVNTRPKEWRSDKYPLRAGVSSFGIGGTNVHAILEEAPGSTAAAGGEKGQALILLSAAAGETLNRVTANLVKYLQANPTVNIADVAYTLQVGRAHFEHRQMFTCSSAVEALETLSCAPEKIRASVLDRRDRQPEVVFMFPGQGAQYIDMALGLYQKEPLFRQEMDRCFELLRALTPHDIKAILYPANIITSISIDQTEITQPVIFIIEYALARLLMAWGIKPAAMIGHSIGEYTAACLSGVFSLTDALKLVVSRGKLMQEMPGGAMLSVKLSPAELLPFLKDGQEELSLAAVNAPNYCVASGTSGAIAQLEQTLQEKGYGGRRLHTSHAFHSAMMTPAVDKFAAYIKKEHITLNEPGIPYISNISGNWITAHEATSPVYWAKHVRETVQFSDGCKVLLAAKGENTVFLEVGPGRTLSAFLHQQAGENTRPGILDLVRHPQDDMADDRLLIDRLGRLWLNGIEPHWREIYRHQKRQRIPLPGYSFGAHACRVDSHESPNPAETAPLSLTKQTNITDWFYVPAWRQSNRRSFQTLETHEKHCWVVFMTDPACKEQENVVERLRKYRQEVIQVKPGPTFAQQGDGCYIVNPHEKSDYNRLFKDILKQDKIPARIVHNWTMARRPGAAPHFEQMAGDLDMGYYSLLHIAGAIAEEAVTGDIQLNVITRGLYRVTGREQLQPAAAPVLGPVKIIPLEYPNIHCRNIDLPFLQVPGMDEEETHGLLEELASAPSEELVAYRDNSRWVRYFKPYPLDKAGTGHGHPRLKMKGVYLITGGFGGMGFSLAQDLAGKYKARLVLVGRSHFPYRDDWQKWLADHEHHAGDDIISRRIRALREMETNGAEIMTFSADIADPVQVQEIMARVKERFGTIDGVIHCAGLAEGALMAARTRGMSAKTMGPKVMGTLVLDSFLADMKPDFLVLFSSLGNILYRKKFGQVAYNAGNEFLDAFAHYMHNAGTTFTVSINWDDWQEVGMSVASAQNWDRLLENPGNKSRESHETGYPLFQRCTVDKIDNVDNVDNYSQAIYTSYLNVAKHWVLAEHCFNGKGVLPGTAYLEMVRAAFAHHTGSGACEIKNISLRSPLVVEPGEEKETQTILKKQAGTAAYTFVIQSRAAGQDKWTGHAGGEIGVLLPQAAASTQSPASYSTAELEARCSREDILITPQRPLHVAHAAENEGIDFGDRWKRIPRRVKTGDNQWLMELALPPEYNDDLQWYRLHPAILDVAGVIPPGIQNLKEGGAYIPVYYQTVRMKKPLPAKVYSYTRLIPGKDGTAAGTCRLDISFMDPQGEVLVEIEGYTLTWADTGMLAYQESRIGTDTGAILPGGRNFYLDIRVPGRLDSLEFYPAARRSPGPGEIEIEVRAAGLNFKDVLLALGILPPPPDKTMKFGQECSGKVTAVGEGVTGFNIGDEVIASGHSCFSAYVTLPAVLAAHKPAHLDFAAAATIPVAFMTAYYSLIKIGRLQKGEKVLIHAAAGGVGLAAVIIARWVGAEIFATAGSPEKREYLRSLGVNHVMNSRTPDFAAEIMAYTGGQGVDVVLNSLAGEFMQKSLSVLGRFGRFLEIGLKDIVNNNRLELKPFEKGLSFFAIQDIPRLPDYTHIWLELMDHFAAGHFTPLTYQLFPITGVAGAFEYMARAKHTGKIVLSLAEKDKVLESLAIGHGQQPGPAREFQKKLQAEGILPAEGVEVFYRILAASEPQVVVSTMDLPGALAAAADLAKVITGESPTGKAGKPGLTGKKTADMAPRNKIQETIGTVWQQFFGTQPIGMEDNFFDMGVTSLDIIQVNNKLNETLAMEIPVAAWFRYPTIQSLTSYLNLDKTAATASTASTALTAATDPAEEDPNEKKRAAKIQQGMKNSGERRKLRKGDTTHD